MRFLRRLFLLLALLAPTHLFAQAPVSKDLYKSSPKILSAFGDLVSKTRQSTVRVLGNGKNVSLGAVVDPAGFIITKASELEGKITVRLNDGKEVAADTIGVDDHNDLALLKVEASNLTPVQWRTSKEAKVGQWVVSVGPQIEPVAIGVISVATRGLKPGDQPPKNSNATGGYLGVGLTEGEGGAKISGVMQGSPAEKAGVKINDIVTHAAGRPVVDNESLINAVQSHKPGDEIALNIQRGEEKLVLKAVLGKMPRAMQGNPQERFGSILSNRRGGFPSILQHDTVIKPSDCGGPLVDLDGKTVGINISRAGRTESYAIPSEVVLAQLDDLKSGKLAPKKIEPKVAVTPPASNLAFVLRAQGKVTDRDPIAFGRPKCHSKSHVVELKEGQEIIIDLTSTEFDPYLMLVRPDGKTIAEDDDGGGDLDARITYRATVPGEYRVIVTTCDPGMTGAYTLSIRERK